MGSSAGVLRASALWYFTIHAGSHERFEGNPRQRLLSLAVRRWWEAKALRSAFRGGTLVQPLGDKSTSLDINQTS